MTATALLVMFAVKFIAQFIDNAVLALILVAIYLGAATVFAYGVFTWMYEVMA